MYLYEEDKGQIWNPCSLQTLPPRKGIQKLSAKTVKKHMEKDPSSKLNETMMFTGTKQRVRVYMTCPQNPKLMILISVSKHLNNHRRERSPQNQKSSIKAKVRRVLDFDVVSPPKALTQGWVYHLLQGTHSNRAQYLIMPMTPVSLSHTAQQTQHSLLRALHQHQVIPEMW